MHRLVIPIPSERIGRALVEVAERELRDPREQVAYFLVEGLKRAGALPADQPTTDARPTAAVETVRT